MAILQALVIGWLPGAILLRLPVLDRPRRAALPAEERTFWAVIISVALSLAVTMTLGAVGRYSLPRLVACDVAVAVVAATAAGFRLGFDRGARRIGIAALIPVAILLFAGTRFFPPDEYLIGGKDPGVYMNEGIQIAQHGGLTIRDQTVASVPSSVRNLFFPDYHNPNYYSLRFMGFFVQNPRSGTVVGQFPHLYPASIAIGYGLDGLTGARAAVGIWALLGVAALYFLGTQLAGRPAAVAAAVLLSLHVLEVWYGKYPNSEMMMQPLLLAALLAADRAFDRDDRFFAIVAGVLLGMQTALRIEAALGIAAAIAVSAAAFARRRRIPWWMLVPLAVLSAAGIVYLIEVLPGYAYYPVGFTRDWILPPLAGGAVVVAVLLVWVRRLDSRVAALERWLPRTIAAASVLALAYGWFLRVPTAGTAPFDAAALRTYTVFYFSVPVLIAAVAGFMLLTTRRFWHAAVTLSTLAIFCAFFFYKIRIVPEHFWMGRRLVPLILPGVLLAASHFALVGLRVPGVARRVVTSIAGIVFLGLVGREYARIARPLLSHVEYAGIVTQLERLASRFGDNDLVIAESTNAGTDIHVLAVPLAYTYGRQVLLLVSPVPDKAMLGDFLDWARTRYAHVFFLGSGGTDVLSRRWSVEPVASEQFKVPEYQTTRWNDFPRFVTQKEFDYGVFEFGPPRPETGDTFDLDVGVNDDLYVVRFHAKERTEGRTIRWTRYNSFLALKPFSGTSRVVTIWMSSGGRPGGVPPAQVNVYLDARPGDSTESGEHLLGTVQVPTGFRAYTFDISPELAADAASADPPRLRIQTNTWNPREALGSGDDRQLGVMIDRVQVR